MMISKSKFKTSVNIKLDLGNEWILDRYIPTPTHIESLTGLLEGFLDKGNKSHILVGSYGSGKSMIGALIANIVSKNVSIGSINNLVDKFDKVNIKEDTVITLLEKAKNLNRTYIPVVINGKQGRFREAVISSIHKSLIQIKPDLTLPSFVEEIKSKINLWENSYAETYKQFISKLSEENWSIDSFLNDITEHDIIAINWFKDIYPSLTAGAELTISYDQDLTEHLSYILDELDKLGFGLYLVYDEFGRFLQSLDKYQTVEAMQDIQDIAELADHHKSGNFNILLITHRNLKQYFLSYGEELQNEFKRIQGRFRVYHTYSDPATFIRLSSQVTLDYRDNWNKKFDFENQVIKYDLFPELNGREIKTIVVENSYPIHPATLYALPRLANAVAQNERTLFTFLESNELGGLANYFQRKNTWYHVNNLFDYFEPAFQEFMGDTLIGNSYLKYLRVQKRIESSLTASSELQLIKLISLWDIASLNNKRKLTKDFISFSLNWDLKKVNEIMSILENKKLIRFRLFDGTWELFEGSTIDINKKIAEMNQIGLEKSNKLELITSILESRYAYPKRYNDEKNMIRFASISPIYASDVTSETVKNSFADEEQCDMRIYYVIPDLEIEEVKSTILDLSESNSRIVFTLPKNTLVNFEEKVLKLSSINKLLEDKYLLNEDSIVEEELLKIKENTNFILKELLEPITQFQNSFWIHEGEILKIKSRVSLSEELSKIMFRIYDKTPVINNEAFNRRLITKQQLNGAKEVVNTIICNESEMSFKGVAKLIFASVVKNNHINSQDECYEVNELRRRLMDEIKLGNGEFKKIIEIFISSPFGIREPIIPVLLTSILRNEWKYIMFYHKDGSYINDIDGDILYDRMLDKPENYTYTYQVMGNEYKEIIEIIDDCFMDYVDKRDASYHPSVRVNRMLLRWFRGLPKITQKTNKLSNKASIFKQLIKKGEFEPDVALNELYQLKLDKDCILKIKQESEGYASNHKKLIETTVFNLTNTQNYNELVNFVHKENELVKIDNKFYAVISKKTDKDNWIDSLTVELVGVKREEWSDATDEVFFKTITSLIESNSKEELKEDYFEVKVENKTMAIPKVELSSKGKVIYENVKTDLQLMGRKLPKEEIKALLYKLLVDYYDENR
ncbi:hypothetical protein [Bacillus sp. B15-48]|uniref:hypothetical protein n=1 Tax=Bacillus sp. B15-48 TaxID=1548601 RepID=UPI00193FEC83|nr:hypothetical protein [Bacillus sp. B15-48]MBM4765099.1 hypothetical protein [Bacillus sp. B15-48]